MKEFLPSQPSYWSGSQTSWLCWSAGSSGRLAAGTSRSVLAGSSPGFCRRTSWPPLGCLFRSSTWVPGSKSALPVWSGFFVWWSSWLGRAGTTGTPARTSPKSALYPGIPLFDDSQCSFNNCRPQSCKFQWTSLGLLLLNTKKCLPNSDNPCILQ